MAWRRVHNLRFGLTGCLMEDWFVPSPRMPARCLLKACKAREKPAVSG